MKTKDRDIFNEIIDKIPMALHLLSIITNRNPNEISNKVQINKEKAHSNIAFTDELNFQDLFSFKQ